MTRRTMTRRGTLLRIAALALVTAVAMWPLACARAADDATAPAAAPTAGAAADAAPPVDTPVTVRARLDPDTTTIGTPFRYTMEITGPPALQIVFAQPTERLGEFDILDFGDTPPTTRDGLTVVTRWYRLAGWEPGHKEIESPPVQWRRPGGELTTAPPANVVMTIESVLAKAGSPTDIRDIKPPLEPPFYWRPYYIAAGALAALLFVAIAGYRALRRGERARVAAPPRPAHEIAIDDLERLRNRGLTEHRLFKEYYSALSGIVRAYLERRFSLRAPEMTTEEFLLTTARGGSLQPAHRALLGEFLTESDLVKFARHVPTLADSERAYAAARRFVDETAAPSTELDEQSTNARARTRRPRGSSDGRPPGAVQERPASARRSSGSSGEVDALR